MKLTRENIYINLQGKSKEELTELWEFLNSIGEQIKHSELVIFITQYHNKNRFISYCQNKWQWGSSRDKQEVTIQQLKEILQPMEDTEFKKGDTVIITDFGIAHSGYFTLYKPYILSKDFNKENGFCVEKDDNNHVNNGWNNAFALGIKIELYEEPSLTEQLEKAEAEVKRLKEAIEEENKPKINDWVYNKEEDIIYQKSYNVFNQYEKKITNPQLIILLENEIK